MEKLTYRQKEILKSFLRSSFSAGLGEESRFFLKLCYSRLGDYEKREASLSIVQRYRDLCKSMEKLINEFLEENSPKILFFSLEQEGVEPEELEEALLTAARTVDFEAAKEIFRIKTYYQQEEDSMALEEMV